MVKLTENAIPVMTSNTAPSGVANIDIGGSLANSMPAFNAFDGNYNTGWMNSGGKLGAISYEFKNEKCIYKYSISSYNAIAQAPIDWTFEGSNNGTNWTILDTKTGVTWTSVGEEKEYLIADASKGFFKKYRINVTNVEQNNVAIGEMKMFEEVVRNKVLLLSNNKTYSLKPTITKHETKMTSNTAPSPLVASASSSSSATYASYKAFSGSLSGEADAWVSAAGKTGWVQLNYGDRKRVNEFALTCRKHATAASGVTYPTFMPKDFNLLASNDGIVFTRISEVRNQTDWSQGETRRFNAIPHKEGYSCYRLEILNTNGGNVICVGELEFFEVSTITELPIVSEENFIKYGSDGAIANLSTKQLTKTYVLQSKINKRADGLWTKELDRKVLSIKSSVPIALYLNEKIYSVNELGEMVLLSTQADIDLLGFTELQMNKQLYALFGEKPTIIAAPETEEDIIVTIETDLFTAYDELGDAAKMFFYTDNEEATEANSSITANWSPLDELEGDFKVAIWTDEPTETAVRQIEVEGIPAPQFVQFVQNVSVYSIQSIIASAANLDNPNLRFSISQNGEIWFTFDSESNKFVPLTDHAKGLTAAELNSITPSQWRIFGAKTVNVGVYIQDEVRGGVQTQLDNLVLIDKVPTQTVEISDTSFYYLNTTARIQIDLYGTTISGVLSDADQTRVQYRIFLNDEPFYPNTGKFTALSPSPQNIQMEFKSSDFKLNDWNTVRVEFKDSFGTTDYWENSFIGRYNGLMFKDTEGYYHSNEIGEVLKYLDFGVLYAGTTSIEHEVLLKNQYGYAIQDLQIAAKNEDYAQGIVLELSKSSAPFLPQAQLSYPNIINDEDEVSFFVRLKTDTEQAPQQEGKINIVARASIVPYDEILE